MSDLTENLAKLNKKINEIGMEKINPLLLKEYVSLINLSDLIKFIQSEVNKEMDPLKQQIIANKVIELISDINKIKYFKKSIYENAILYFYSNRTDMYIKKNIENDSINRIFSEINAHKSYEVYIKNKMIEKNESLLTSDKLKDLLNTFSDIDEFKIKIKH